MAKPIAVLVAIVRLFAVGLGCFIVTTSMADLAGLVPYSDDPPPFAHKLVKAVPITMWGLSLLLPYRSVGSPLARWVVGAGLAAGAIWVLYLSFHGVVRYADGTMSWHGLVADAVLLSITAGNGWAFLLISGHRLREDA